MKTFLDTAYFVVTTLGWFTVASAWWLIETCWPALMIAGGIWLGLKWAGAFV